MAKSFWGNDESEEIENDLVFYRIEEFEDADGVIDERVVVMKTEMRRDKLPRRQPLKIDPQRLQAADEALKRFFTR
ncbi:MAG: hypothetical protein HKN47_03010 [Pirellulaceae bacterium]|nr:hypothetical protein [Pirellulaceae bacterium]